VETASAGRVDVVVVDVTAEVVVVLGTTDVDVMVFVVVVGLVTVLNTVSVVCFVIV